MRMDTIYRAAMRKTASPEENEYHIDAAVDDEGNHPARPPRTKDEIKSLNREAEAKRLVAKGGKAAANFIAGAKEKGGQAVKTVKAGIQTSKGKQNKNQGSNAPQPEKPKPAKPESSKGSVPTEQETASKQSQQDSDGTRDGKHPGTSFKQFVQQLNGIDYGVGAGTAIGAGYALRDRVKSVPMRILVPLLAGGTGTAVSSSVRSLLNK